MKEIKLMFYKTNPSEKNTGLKNVLWEIVTHESQVIHDWGFANWTGTEWEAIEVPEGYTASVAYWANTIDPDALLKDKRIITSV